MNRSSLWCGVLLVLGCDHGSLAVPAAEHDAATVLDANFPDRHLDDTGVADATIADSASHDGGGQDRGFPDGAMASDSGTGRDSISAGDAGSICPGQAVTTIPSFPYQDSADTSTSSHDLFDQYSCSPQAESGPERLYAVTLSQPGTLIAMLDDGSSAGADIDIHLLSACSPSSCLARGHRGLSAHLSAGTYLLVADTWANASGVEFAGPYTLFAHFLADGTNCGMLGESLNRIGTSEALAMPATGPVVLEAHLVTSQEFSGGSWPQSITDGITAHYTLSESTTGYSMSRSEPWAPCCEPSNEYGQGSTSRPPVDAEAFYVNMRWASAPPRGQRYIVFNGLSGRAVVAAAGYENGPGDLTRIGGACEEIHDHLQTGHLDVLTFGVARDQNLPYGPITCLP